MMRTRLHDMLFQLKRENDWLVDAALGLIVIGALVIGFAGSSDWSKIVGGAVLGAGFSIVIAAVTGRRAVAQQYAKEANLRRKDQVYGPLHAELKRVREYLEDVKHGTRPYPPRIEVGDPPPLYEAPEFQGPATSWVPTLSLWAAFKADYRADDFSEAGKRLLDELDAAAGPYNAAIRAAEGPTIDALAAALDTTISSTKETAEYQDWHLNDEAERAVTPYTHNPVPQDWLRRLAPQTGTPSSDLGREWARSWVKSWPFYHLPATLGWLLAGNAVRAAQHVHAGYSGPGDPAPPLEWITQIMQAAIDSEQQSAPYIEVQSTSTAFLDKVKKAEIMLENGLRDIRNRYEGGMPPV